MEQKNKVRWAIAVIVLGVGYDIYYFVGKRRAKVASSVATSPVDQPLEDQIEQQAERQRATPKVDVGFYASVLAAEAELHQKPTLITKAAHNPFATDEEQRRGLRHDQIIAADSAPQAKVSDTVGVVSKDPLAGFVLKAVMIRAKRSVALINEALLSLGDVLPDTEWHIESIEQNVVQLRNGDQTRSLRLQ